MTTDNRRGEFERWAQNIGGDLRKTPHGNYLYMQNEYNAWQSSCASMEAENKRLREALTHARYHLNTINFNSEGEYQHVLDDIDQALAWGAEQRLKILLQDVSPSGSLHIVVGDLNVEDEHLDACAALPDITDAEKEILQLLRLFSPERRKQILLDAEEEAQRVHK